MAKIYWIDRKIELDHASFFSKHDLGLTRGYGIFDFFRTYSKKPFHLKEHLDRFFYSAKEVDLEIPYTLQELIEGIDCLIDQFPCVDLGIKLYLTAGESKDGFLPCHQPTFWMVASEIHSLPFYEGIHLKTIPYEREWPDIKSLNYMRACMHTKRYSSLGYHDIIYMNRSNEMMESSTSNLFFFMGENLITPSEKILKGITREVILYLAKDHFNIEYRPLNREELKLVDECFVTGTTKEICPVMRIDDKQLESNHVKSKTIFLKNLFQDYVKSETKPIFELEFKHRSYVSTCL